MKQDMKQLIMNRRKKTAGGYDLGRISQYRNEIYGFCALWIVLYHAPLFGYTWESPFRLFGMGRIGVDMFLFLSGVSLYFSFVKDRRCLPFYRRRLIRIYIPVAALLPYYVYISLPFRKNILYWSVLILRLFNLDFWLTGYSQFWYVAMIIAAYLIYPLLYHIIFHDEDMRRQAVRTILICLVETAWILFLYKAHPGYYNETKIAWTRFPIFTLGCFAGRCVYDRAAVSDLTAAFLMAAGVVSGGILYLCYYAAGFSPIQIILTYVFGLFLVLALSALFYASERSGLSIWNQWFRALGNMSLEIYIVHIMLTVFYQNGALFSFVKGTFTRYLLIVLASLAAAFLWNRFNRKMTHILYSFFTSQNEVL